MKKEKFEIREVNTDLVKVQKDAVTALMKAGFEFDRTVQDIFYFKKNGKTVKLFWDV